jgi:hypothetical protein
MKRYNLNIIKYSENYLQHNFHSFDSVDWSLISSYQVLSEEFIEKKFT